jgi:hypothetical protein
MGRRAGETERKDWLEITMENSKLRSRKNEEGQG